MKGQPVYGCLTLHNGIWKTIKRKRIPQIKIRQIVRLNDKIMINSNIPNITAANLCLLLQKEQNVKGGEGPSGKQAVGINNGTR